MRPAVGDKDTPTGENLPEVRTKEARVLSCEWPPDLSVQCPGHRAGGGMGLAGQDVLGWFQVLDHDMSLRGEKKYGGVRRERAFWPTCLHSPLCHQPNLGVHGDREKSGDRSSLQ